MAALAALQQFIAAHLGDPPRSGQISRLPPSQA